MGKKIEKEIAELLLILHNKRFFWSAKEKD